MINFTQIANFAKTNETARFNKAAQSPIKAGENKFERTPAQDQVSFGMAQVNTRQEIEAAEAPFIEADKNVEKMQSTFDELIKKAPDKLYDSLIQKDAQRIVAETQQRITKSFSGIRNFNYIDTTNIFKTPEEKIKNKILKAVEKTSGETSSFKDSIKGLSMYACEYKHMDKINAYQHGLAEKVRLAEAYSVEKGEKFHETQIFKDLKQDAENLEKYAPKHKFRIDVIKNLITKSDLAPEKSLDLLETYDYCLGDEIKKPTNTKKHTTYTAEEQKSIDYLAAKGSAYMAYMGI